MSNEKNEGESCSIGHCSVCGIFDELVELPGRKERCCLSCSADLAMVALLTGEIDAATLNGRETRSLMEELNALSVRVLAQSQSTGSGSITF